MSNGSIEGSGHQNRTRMSNWGENEGEGVQTAVTLFSTCNPLSWQTHTMPQTSVSLTFDQCGQAANYATWDKYE